MEYFLEIGQGITCACALLSGMRRYAVLDNSSKIVLLIIAASLFFELPALYASPYDNYVLVHTGVAIRFLLAGIYFNHTIDVFIRSNKGLKIGLAGLLSGAGTACYALGHYVSLAECLCVILMCLFSLYRLLATHDQLRLLYYHHFWFIVLFLFYWSVTYFINSYFIYDPLLPAGHTLSAGQSMKLISMLTYSGACCIFWLHKKKFAVHE